VENKTVEMVVKDLFLADNLPVSWDVDVRSKSKMAAKFPEV